MKIKFYKTTILGIIFFQFISVRFSLASEISNLNDIEPLHYVQQFTIPSKEASELLKPHWHHNNKGKLAQQIEVSSPTLKSLIEEKKANKALKQFNITLIEDSKFWAEIFPTPYAKAQIILGQLLSETPETVVAHQLEVSVNSLQSFLQGNKDKEILKQLPKVSIEN
ncbi:MAG: hypothetical protein BGO77_02395 [Caedibacter sp. 37-49]|nr:MAG: hypothetical protein BGO77_02395 [Caedibacter sp. 37-49]